MLSLFASLGYYVFLIFSGLLFLIFSPSTLVYADAHNMLLMMTICSCIILWLLFFYFLVTNDTFREIAFTRITRKGNKIFSIARACLLWSLTPRFSYVVSINVIPTVLLSIPFNMVVAT